MSIGSQLRAAREGRHLSASDVAAATRSKIQYIEAIERDDYSLFAAPIYGKGFIRLYAQYVGLDPLPLLEAYGAAVRARKSPSLISESGEPPTAVPAPPSAAPPAAAPVPAAVVADAPAPRNRSREFNLFNAESGTPPAAAPPPAPVAASRADRTTEARALLREVVIRWWLALRESWSLGKTRAAEMHPERDPWKVVPIVIGIVIVIIFVVSGLSRCAHRRDVAAGPVRGGGGELRLAAEAPEPYFD